MKKFFNSLGFRFLGGSFQIDSILEMLNIGNPLIEINGTFLVYLKTGLANAFRFRDNTKGQDILSIDTDADEMRAGSDYSVQGFAGKKRIFINQANVSSVMGGVIDPAVEYFIDGVIDFTGVSVEIPTGGINIKGYGFDISKITNAETSFTLFTSPVGGSGNILITDLAVEVTGTTAKVYDVFSATGNEAYEIDKVNFNDCTSLGTIDNYRQGLETGTGRFGGTPELTLKGVWTGGYFIDTSIVRGLTDSAFTLFKSGTGFLMSSRFRSNQNIDLSDSSSFFDFSQSNFVNPSTLQLDGLIITRDGVFDAEDTNLTPNIDATDLASFWSNCQGLSNTFVGGLNTITTETVTTINTINVFEILNATAWTPADLAHFDEPSDGQLRHLGNSPREFKITADLTIDGTANDDLSIKVEKWDDSASGFVDVFEQRREVNSFVGSRNVAFFTINVNTILNNNDYIRLKVANHSGTNNVTGENSSFFRLERR